MFIQLGKRVINLGTVRGYRVREEDGAPVLVISLESEEIAFRGKEAITVYDQIQAVTKPVVIKVPDNVHFTSD